MKLRVNQTAICIVIWATVFFHVFLTIAIFCHVALNEIQSKEHKHLHVQFFLSVYLLDFETKLQILFKCI